jgi:hypothetical protein
MTKEPAVLLHKTLFSQAMNRVVNDKQFTANLESKPGTTLKAMGFDLPANTVASLDKTPLSQQVQAVLGPGVARAAETYVHVGVSVGVSVAVDTILLDHPEMTNEQLSGMLQKFESRGVAVK